MTEVRTNEVEANKFHKGNGSTVSTIGLPRQSYLKS